MTKKYLRQVFKMYLQKTSMKNVKEENHFMAIIFNPPYGVHGVSFALWDNIIETIYHILSMVEFLLERLIYVNKFQMP